MPEQDQQGGRGGLRGGTAAATRADDTRACEEAGECGQFDDAGCLLPREIGGPKDPQPTRYGDWQRAGRCIDF